MGLSRWPEILAVALLAGRQGKVLISWRVSQNHPERCAEKRDELCKQLQADLDPSAERKATNLRKKLVNVNSFEAVALEWYNKQLHTWVEHHASDVKRRLESNIFPTLGKRPIDQINALELLEAIRKIEARGAYDLAHRVLQVCGQVTLIARFLLASDSRDSQDGCMLFISVRCHILFSLGIAALLDGAGLGIYTVARFRLN